MKIDKLNSNHIIADDGKVFQRICDNAITGKEMWLGYVYYLNGKKLDIPVLEKPEHFREVNEEETNDEPVELPEVIDNSIDNSDIGENSQNNEEQENVNTPVTMGELRKMQREIKALSTMSYSIINKFPLSSEVALSVKELYPEWKDIIGSNVTQGFRFRYNGVLYEVIEAHTLQSELISDIASTSLYKAVTVQEEESGTLEIQ